MRSISVIIPVFNEQETIDTCLRQVSDFLSEKKILFEIIVVNDGSLDLTRQRLATWANQIVVIDNDQNQGKGYSVKRGLLAGKYEWLLFLDADLSTPISEVNKFIDHNITHDSMIGSRRIQNSKIVTSQPKIKDFAGRVGNKLVKKISGLSYDDTQC